MNRWIVSATCWLALLAATGLAAPPESPRQPIVPSDDLAAACAASLAQLDHPDFFVRQQAAERLRAWAADPRTARQFSAILRRHWHRGQLSLEARAALRPLMATLQERPAADSSDSPSVEPARLLEGLTSADFFVRQSAELWLAEALRDSANLSPLRGELNRKLSDPELPSADRPALGRAWESLRGAWLLSDESSISEAQPTEQQMIAWIDRLAAPTPAGGNAFAWTQREAAARELRDALAIYPQTDRLKAILEQQLAETQLSADSRRRLESLLEWTRPVLVAEYWEQGRNLAVQYLYVNVPTTPEHGLRPSHFDLVDDRTAHCVSGNSLAPGDHPVGVAFPHPRQRNAEFRLVNLSTPRRRMRYEHELKRSDAERWATISRQTLDRILQTARPFSAEELHMLFDLDAVELSRFAGPWFEQVDEGPGLAESRSSGRVRLSQHAALCRILIDRGTRHAVPGIVAAMEKLRIRAPDEHERFSLPWIAALTIAHRDPWPEVDDWLLGLLDRQDALEWVEDRQPARSNLGATAAAILLRRHNAEPEQFGLVRLSAEFADGFEWTGYRYRTGEDSSRIRGWWHAQLRTAKVGPN